MLGIGADRGANVEDDRFPPQRRPKHGNSRPVNRRNHVQANLGHRHERAGVTRGKGGIGLAPFDGFERLPHRRGAPAVAQRLAGLVFHTDFDIRVPHARDAGEPRIGCKQGFQPRLIAEKRETEGMLGQRERGAR